MLTDVELGSDGEYYIRRKLNATELRKFKLIQNNNNDAHNNERLIAIPEVKQIIRNKQRRQLSYRYPPFFITFISIFELVSFVYYALRSEEQLTLIGPVPYQSKLIYNPHRRYEIWRYLTYMFIHAGYWHISFNLLTQLAVGIPLEIVHKFEPIFIIYIGGIVAGSLGNSIADPHSYLAGASAGCYALIAAHLSNLILNWNEIQGSCCRFFSILLFTSYDFGTAVYERHIKVSSVEHRTSYGGHLAGFASGILLGLICLRNVREHSWEREAKKWAAFIYIGSVVSIETICLISRVDLVLKVD